MTHSEGGICSELQQTFDSRQTQVGCSDVQGGAEVKVAAGGIDLCGGNKEGVFLSRRLGFFWGVFCFT